MINKLPIPKEIDNLIAESTALFDMREIFAKLPFGYKKALRCAKEAEIKKHDFWQKVYALYPEIEGKRYKYDTYSMAISENKEEGKND